MSGRLRVLARALLVCGAVVALDQITKGAVRDRIARGESVDLLPFVQLQHTRNQGVAFGLGGEISPLLIAVAVAGLAGLMAYLTLRPGAEPVAWLPAGLLVGGALGNLLDRVRDGAVTDFIDVGAWPTFNLADAAIVVGVALLALSALRGDRAERERDGP